MTSTLGSRSCRTDGGDTTGFRGLPVFARAGAVVPSQKTLQYTDQRALDTLQLRVFPGSAKSDADARTVRFTVPASASRMELVH
jgi:alpha-glucosidase (family GH31 glycosyl hydrolase)